MSKILDIVHRIISTYLIKKAGLIKKTARTGAVAWLGDNIQDFPNLKQGMINKNFKDSQKNYLEQPIFFCQIHYMGAGARSSVKVNLVKNFLM